MLHSANHPLPQPNSLAAHIAREQSEHDWGRGMLDNVIRLHAVPEIHGKPAETHLESAIALAKQGDTTKMNEIAEHLREVHRALYPGRSR